MRCDIDGNLWCGWGMGTEELDGVVVFAPDGTPIGRIALPERCANVCFGGSSATACLWRRPNRCMPCTSIPRASRVGKTWRQERTHYAQTDIDRHLYLLPRDVQQRHHDQAPERLQAASGRSRRRRHVGQDGQRKSCTCWLMGTGHTGCISKCGPMPAWTPSIPFFVTSGSNAADI